ncbi:MAG: FAD-binding oxidoreductase [Promethearchaeota archaeon]
MTPENANQDPTDDLMKYQQAMKESHKNQRNVKDFTLKDNLKEILGRIHPGNMQVQVQKIEDLSHDTKSITLIPAGETKFLAPFRAGQYIAVKVEVNGVRTTRAFSLTSSPNDLSSYKLGIKRKPTGFVSLYLLDNLKVGDLLEISEPMGQFYHNPIFHGKNLVFIAGGSGITPFVSMMQDIVERKLNLNIWLIFGSLSEKDLLYKEKITTLQQRNENIYVDYVLSSPGPNWEGSSGFITSEIIKKNVPTPKNCYYYIVGNRPMNKFVISELSNLGVSRHRILTEAFGTPDDVTQVVGWPKEIPANQIFNLTLEYSLDGSLQKTNIEIKSHEPLLNSIERAKIPGLLIDNGCRSGQCALCRSKLEKGIVFVPPTVIIRKSDMENGFIHPCISYPLSDLALKVI